MCCAFLPYAGRKKIKYNACSGVHIKCSKQVEKETYIKVLLYSRPLILENGKVVHLYARIETYRPKKQLFAISLQK